MDLTFHTIYLLIGPSGCGKTTFAKRLKEAANEFGVAHLESDAVRRDLLGRELHKYDREMLQVSEQAFAVLQAKIQAHASYPVNTPFIVIDTTGLSDTFRAQQFAVAKQHNYNVEAVLFDYRDNDEYFKGLVDPNREIIHNHIKNFRQATLPKLERKEFERIHKIKSKDDILNVEFNIPQSETWKSHQLPAGPDYFIVGDVQGCYDHLIQLLERKGFGFLNKENPATCTMIGLNEPGRETVVVLAGDWVNKGRQSKEVLQFIAGNLDRIRLVRGNHENYLNRYFFEKGGKDNSLSPEFIAHYFTCTQEWKDDPGAVELFGRINKEARDFLVHPNFIVTHAPCAKKYLGKMDDKSLKSQRQNRYPRRENLDDNAHQKALEKHFTPFREEAVWNQPLHFFGHVAMQRHYLHKNKIGLDTGLVHGNRLTGVTVTREKNHTFFLSVPWGDTRTCPAPESLVSGLFTEKMKLPRLEMADIDPRQRRKLYRYAKDKIQYISGTMCPADKTPDNLESVASALEYYQSRNVSEVILQPKWMGSRCQIYLTRDPATCFATSRSGYIIKHVDLTKLLAKVHAQFLPKMNDLSAKMLILDGELLPWSVLGAGLISGQYGPVASGIGGELELLQSTNFEKHLEDARTKLETSGFLQDVATTKKEAMIKKYGQSQYNTFLRLNGFDWPPLADQETWFKTYTEELAIHGKLVTDENDIDYKPFSLLKVIKEDTSEEVTGLTWTNEEQYKWVTNEPYLVVLTETGKDLAQAFYEGLVADRYEGVVVKPQKAQIPSVAPYLKVRNPNYLSLIYGYDFTRPKKWEKLWRQKNIRNKLKLSIEEHNLACEMLRFPYDGITEENQEYLSTVATLCSEVEKEKGLDPRL